MVYAQASYYFANVGADNVRCVKLAAEPNLKSYVVTFTAAEVIECRRRPDFKLSWHNAFFRFDFFCKRLDYGKNIVQVPVRNILAVYADPFVDLEKIRGNVFSDLVARILKNRGYVSGNRSLTVGARNVNAFEILFGGAELFEKPGNS